MVPVMHCIHTGVIELPFEWDGTLSDDDEKEWQRPRGTEVVRGTLRATFIAGEDTRCTRCFTEETEADLPAIGTLCIRRRVLRKMTGGELPQRVRVTIEAIDSE